MDKEQEGREGGGVDSMVDVSFGDTPAGKSGPVTGQGVPSLYDTYAGSLVSHGMVMQVLGYGDKLSVYY